jgi:hypothetical protein
VCAPVVAGRPPLLQRLVLAQAETKPFKPQPMQAAGGEVPLDDNLGTLSLKVGTRSAKAQAVPSRSTTRRLSAPCKEADPKLAMA